MLKKDF